jgi:hypothetical protein
MYDAVDADETVGMFTVGGVRFDINFRLWLSGVSRNQFKGRALVACSTVCMSCEHYNGAASKMGLQLTSLAGAHTTSCVGLSSFPWL